MNSPALQTIRRRRFWLPLVALAATSSIARAQWVTEDYSLKQGWNAIWLPLDVPHTDIAEVVPAEIEEIWRWNADQAGTLQDVQSPSQTELQWNVWRRILADGPITLGKLTPGAAYLVKVADTAPATLTWSIKGKPVPPALVLSSTGINLVGFPTLTGAATPKLSAFFGFDAALGALPRVHAYNGGLLSATNPLTITTNQFHLNSATRHQAYWLPVADRTEYYGPIKVEVGRAGGFIFGEDGLSISLRVSNVIAEEIRPQTVTATITPVVSDPAPAGQAAVAGVVPLAERGELDITTGLFSYTQLTTEATVPVGQKGKIDVTLQPGETKEIVLTVNRSHMGQTPGAVFQSLLRVTDSLNQTRIDLPVSAVATSRAGLWSGSAIVSNVDRQLGAVSTLEKAPAPFPLRLVLHANAAGQVRLLQQAITGTQAGQKVVALTETAFTSPGAPETRNSSTHFPTALNEEGTGALGLAGTLKFDFTLGHNDLRNPFIHQYHPDHDTLDERFTSGLPAGRESPTIRREITLTFVTADATKFDPAWGATTLGGTYTETITGLRARPITVSGAFVINRTSPAATLIP